VDSEAVTARAMMLHGIASRIRVGPTGATFVSEPGQIPTIALGDTLNGAALDPDTDPRCGLLSGRAAAISHYFHDRLP
jgi:hypothetical protein